MARISWGRPSLFQTAPSTDGAPAANAKWENIDTPKDGTLKINVTEGSSKEAVEEGGGLVDVSFNKNTYEMEFAEFVKKGKTSIFEDDDGIVEGEHAFRFLPEDDECEGRLIERAIVRVLETYTTAEGILRTFKARCLKPKAGKIVKPYHKTETANV